VTIIELLASTAITAAVMAGVVAALASAQSTFLAQSQRADARQRLRAVAETLTREVMTATAVLPYRRGAVAEDAITIVQGPARHVYYLGADAQLRHYDGLVTDLPVVDGVTRLAFEYAGEAGVIPLASMGDGPWLPDAADPARIDADALRVRRVRIRVALAGTSPSLEAVIDVSPRNIGVAP
jgi:hypothetical protein